MKKYLVALLAVVLVESGCKQSSRQSEAVIEEEAVSEAAPAVQVAESAPVESATVPEGAVALKQLENPGTWTVTASTQEAQFQAAHAVDGSVATRWGSEFADGQWWMVDFGKDEMLDTILLSWEDAYAREFGVLLSSDGSAWDEVYSTTNGMGGTDVVEFPARAVRFVKVDCRKRATQWGVSLIEVQFNTEASAGAEASASSGTGDYGPRLAIDGKPSTRWSSDFTDEAWWQVRFPEARELAGAKILWETAFAEKYDVAVSEDGTQWTTVCDMPEGDGRTDVLFFKPVKARYFRVNCHQRGTGWGNSFYEVKFFDKDQAPVVTATSSRDGEPAELALDGDRATAWHSAADGDQVLTVQLPDRMSLGGVELTWGADYARSYVLETSLDGTNWVTVMTEQNGNGGKDFAFFPAGDGRFVRVACKASSGGQGYALAHLEFKSGEEQATPIRAYQAKAKDAKPGRYPMWLSRQQEFWTVIGIPDDEHEAIIGETGVFEPKKGAPSVQPFVLRDGAMTTWADVQLEQALEDEYLPLPSVKWTASGWTLGIAAVAFGKPGDSCVAVRYRFTNTGAERFNGALALAVRPVQVNPLWQFGGMSPIKEAACQPGTNGAAVLVDGARVIVSATPPAAMGAAALGDGDIVDFFERGVMPETLTASDGEGKTSMGLQYSLAVEPGASADVVLVYPLHAASAVPESFVAAPSAAFDQAWAEQAAAWRQTLNTPDIRMPEKRLVNFLKSNKAYVLINRDPPWFKPGSRNYSHGWMRDGALTGVAMMRLGRPDLAVAFIKAFSGFVGDNGWVPYMILESGNPIGFNANPDSGEGQEYDSQGEFAFIVRQAYDYTRDEEMLKQAYPKVAAALRYAKALRERRKTDEYRNDPEKQAYFGVLPESNSHEGYYPAKHSYWDDIWLLRGYKDGVYLAGRTGNTNDAAWMRAEEEDLRTCMYNSMLKVIGLHGMKNLPGCVELGDSDPTSTSVAIMVADETDRLPQPYGLATFDLYYTNFSKRLVPGGEDTFTPYESRNADVFVRLNQRERALTVLRYFTGQSSRPHNWNHLAEVVHAKMRSPSYIGDMPHTWCGSDYINAVRSIFVFEHNGSLVLASGVDPAWLDEGVSVQGLPTQVGDVSYDFRKEGEGYVFTASGTAVPRDGFVIWLPEPLAGLSAEVDGMPVEITDGAIRFAKLPAAIKLKPAVNP